MPSVLAWGMAFGAAAVAVGMLPGWAMAMSAISWSGTAQLAAVGMIQQPLAAIFATSLLVSLRFIPMSLSLAGLMPDVPRWLRVLTACGLADGSFALLASGKERSPAYVFGTWFGQYSAWVVGTVIGVLAAPLLPAAVLSASDALIAAIFVVLAAMVCTDREKTAVAAATAGIAVLVALVLPTGVALAAAAVLVSGVWVRATR